MTKQRILFITTGGTIASVHTPQGLRPVLSSDELLAHLPELNDLCIPETLALCSIDSTDLGQEHWLMMARAIQENYALYDGFIICHGTDTLAYSAAALSYLIQNADKPIILTGAQQPISNEITDAKKNLRDSVICALETDRFGYRQDPNGGGQQFHYGLDIAADEGAVITAFAAGTVTAVGDSAELGNYVTVQHPGGFVTLYAHCSRINASSGQQVRPGDPIAEVGHTGNATGPHLHFELMKDGVYVNPIYYYAAP